MCLKIASSSTAKTVRKLASKRRRSPAAVAGTVRGKTLHFALSEVLELGNLASELLEINGRTVSVKLGVCSQQMKRPISVMCLSKAGQYKPLFVLKRIDLAQIGSAKRPRGLGRLHDYE